MSLVRALQAVIKPVIKQSRRCIHQRSVTSLPRAFKRSANHSFTLRSLFIQTQPTPNQNSMKFLPGCEVLPSDANTLEFTDLKKAMLKSPLASSLMQIDGVDSVMLANDFISVNITDGSDWTLLKPQIYAAIQDHFASGLPTLKQSNNAESSQKQASTQSLSGQQYNTEELEIVSMIKELIETRIRPSVQEDGGDIMFIDYEPSTGVVKVQMQGSCKGCASSSVTLKNGIENMLMHYVPEVSSVEEWKDEELEAVSNDELRKLEESLAKISKAKESS